MYTNADACMFIRLLALAAELTHFIPRLEVTEIVGKIRDDITEVRSGLAEKFVMLVGKLTGFERRIESLESTGGENTRFRMLAEVFFIRLCLNVSYTFFACFD